MGNTRGSSMDGAIALCLLSWPSKIKGVTKIGPGKVGSVVALLMHEVLDSFLENTLKKKNIYIYGMGITEKICKLNYSYM